MNYTKSFYEGKYPAPQWNVAENHQGKDVSGGRIIAWFYEETEADEYVEMKERSYSLRNFAKNPDFHKLQEIVVLLDGFHGNKEQIIIVDESGMKRITDCINLAMEGGIKYESFHPKTSTTIDARREIHSLYILGYTFHFTTDKEWLKKL